ncbi:TPA: N-6 DNA methylase [Enterobacter sichuanensis]|nr:N-6 DNA methylase [Enterobacter sichuanensis]
MPEISKALQKPLGKFFTREAISDLLVSSLSIQDPQVVLDLGSGDGSLSKAAAKRWNNAKFITVDIDNDTHLPNLLGNYSVSQHTHYKLDALLPSLISDIGLSKEKIDLALCNPPFIKPQWNEKHTEFLRQAGFTESIVGIGSVTAEVLFVIQNLLSLREGGQLGLIIPDGFISGEKSRQFRSFILKSNSIDKVIKLPKNSFVGTNIQAHIVIITKGVSKDFIELSDFSKGYCTKTLHIQKEQAIDSLDITYHSIFGSEQGKWITLSDIGCKISRGNYNSKQCRTSGLKIFHTVDIPVDKNQIEFDDEGNKEIIKSENKVYAKKGDILVARVGRNLARQICFVNKGEALISDCIYRLDVPQSWKMKVFHFLTSKKGYEVLTSMMRGTGASYLTSTMLLRLPLIGVRKKNHDK